MIDLLAVEHVADADLQLVEAIENVELGERNAGNAVGGDRLAYQRCVEPAAAALAARDRTEFMTLLAEELTDLVLQLGRERAFADASRVGLGDAENIAERARPMPEPADAWPATVLDEVTNG
jgi:hypothetical protein